MAITPIESWIRPQDESFSIAQGAVQRITAQDLVGDDTALNGAQISLQKINQPEHGSVVQNADGSYTYTPANGYTGSDKFTYVVQDQNGNFCTETVYVTVTAPTPNKAPVVQDEWADVVSGQAVSAHESLLLANDSDTDGGTLSVGNYGKPAHGTLSRAADGTLTYTPTAGYVGADSFTYEVRDGQGGVTVGTVHLNVTPCGENKAPVVTGEEASLRAGSSVSAPESLLLGNDVDPEGGALSIKPDGYGQPAHGTLTRAADGTLTYTPNAGYVGDDSFTYTVVDAQGKSSQGTVTLHVTAGMKAPTIDGVDDNAGARQGNIGNGGQTDDTTPTLKGTAEPGARVDVYDGTTKIGSTTADASGNWVLTPATPLGNGAHDFKVVAVATDGASANSSPYSIAIGPDGELGAPVVRIHDDADNNGYINGSEQSGPVTVTVELPAGAQVGDTVTVQDQAGNLNGKKLVAADIAAGKVVFTDVFPLPADGQTLTVSATVKPALGNASPVGSDSAVVDLTADSKPTVELTTDANNDGKISKAELDAAGGIDAKITLPADARVGDTLRLVDQDGHVYERKLNAADIAAKTLTLDNVFAAPADGRTVTLNATLVDPAGNVSAPGQDSATINTVAPTVQISILDDKNDDGTLTRNELAGATRVDIRVDLPGSIRVGDMLEVTDNAGNGVSKRITQADVDAHAVSFNDAFPLPAAGATLTVTAKVTDVANNVSPLATDSVKFDGNFSPIGTDDVADVRAFATPLVSILAMNQDTASVVPGGQTWYTADGDAGRAVYGQLSSLLTAGMKVQIASSDHPGQWLDAVVSSDGLHWTAVDTQAHTGNWSYTARLLDASNQPVSTSAAQDVVLQAAELQAPTIESFGGQAGDKSIALGTSTTDQTLVVNGKAAAGAASAGHSIEVYANGSGHLLGTTTVKADGSWSVDLTGTPLANGGSKYSFYAREMDQSGNTSPWSNKAALTILSPNGAVENWADFGAGTGQASNLVVNGTLQTAEGVVNVKATIGYGYVYADAPVATGLQGLFPGGKADGSEDNMLGIYPGYSATLTFDKLVSNPNLLLSSIYGPVTITATRADGTSFNPTLSFVDNTPENYPALTNINGNVVNGASNAQGVIELAGDIKSITITSSNGGAWGYFQLAQKTISGGTVLPADDGSITAGVGGSHSAGDDTVSFGTQADLDAAVAKGLDGGAGTDTLRLTGDGLRLDLTNHSSTPGVAQDVNGFEKFDLVAGSGRNALVMSVNDVLAQGRTNAFLQNGKTQVLVKGDSSDSLNLTHLVDNGGDTGNWSAAGTVQIDGITYNVFNHSSLSAQVLAQQGLKVQVPADPGVAAKTTTFPEATGNVLTNDQDPDGQVKDLRVAGVDNNSDVAPGENIGTPLAGKYGHLTMNPDGTYTYVADMSAGLTQPAVDVFYYLPKDAGGATSVNPVKLTFNVDPALANISAVSHPDAVTEGQSLEYTVTTTVSAVATAVNLTLISGTATVGSDTTGPMQVNLGKGWVDVVGGQVLLPAGTASFKVRVATTDDSTIEPNESFSLKVTSASGSSQTVESTILDNDLLGNKVTGNEDTALTLKWSDFNLNNLNGALPKLVISSLPADGKLEYNDGAGWKAVTLNQEISKSDIDANKLRFTPDANESGIDAYKADGIGNKLNDYAQVQFTAFDDAGHTFSGGKVNIDIAPVADLGTLTATLTNSGHVYGTYYGNWPFSDPRPADNNTVVDKIVVSVAGGSNDVDGSERTMIALTHIDGHGYGGRVYDANFQWIQPDSEGVVWVQPNATVYVSYGVCTLDMDYGVYRQEVDSSGKVLDMVGGPTQHHHYVSPLVLDLNGDGVQTVDVTHGTYFDLDADGKSTRTGWTDGKDGFLVLDRNGNGQIDNGSELFGDATPTANGRAKNGFAALAEMDSNGDGHITAADQGFEHLQVWVDTNGDGVSQASELRSLVEVGILSFDLAAKDSTAVQNGNLIGLVSSFTMTDGTQHEMADVWFAGNGETAPALQAGDLLAQDAHLPVGGNAPAGPVAAPIEPALVDASHLHWQASLHREVLTEQSMM